MQPNIKFSYDGFINIAPGKDCKQSSSHVKWGRNRPPSALVDEQLNLDYAIHTKIESHPFWQIDLGGLEPLSYLVVHNRPGFESRCLPLLITFLSEDNTWTEFGSVSYPFGNDQDGGPLVVAFRGIKASAVRITACADTALHLRHVKILIEKSYFDLQIVSRILSIPPIPPAVGSSEGLRIHNNKRKHFDHFDALHVNTRQRLGNFLICVANAVAVALSYGIKKIFIDRERFFEQDFGKINNNQEIIFEPIGDDQFPDTSIVLSASFWRLRFISHKLTSKSEETIGLRFIDGVDYSKIFTEFVGPNIFGPIDPYPSNVVTAHFRSGDVFATSGKIPQSYGQPPLSYYKYCLTHAIKAGGEKVIVVYEDKSNPCVEAFEAWMKKTDIPHKLMSSDLKTDALEIRRSSNLISGFGTFAPILVAQNLNLRSIYFFRLALFPSFFGASTEKYIVRDVANEFIEAGNWTNSAEQRRQLLDYPEEKLAL